MERDELERLVGGRLRLQYDEILYHPRMPEARYAYIKSFLNLYQDDPFLARLLMQAGRFFVFHCVAVLEAAQDPSRRETWFTVAALKRLLAMFGYASDRQVDHLVARLHGVGFLEHRRAEGDRRVRLLGSTQKLRFHHMEWLATHYLPLATLFPEHDYGPVLARDRDFHTLHCGTSLPFHGVAARLMMQFADSLMFFSHAAGPLIENAVLLAATESADPSAAISYMEVAQRFGVSRTHVRNLMENAETAGLVQITGKGGHSILILPRYWTCYDRGLALGMYLHDAVNLVVMRRWLESRGADSVDTSSHAKATSEGQSA